MKDKFGVIGIMDNLKKGDLPGNQSVYIVLNSSERLNNGNIAVTTDLATDSEVDSVIDKLIQDLETVRKMAKKKIGKKAKDVLT